ncbi:MAG TPA: ABC transporter permease [Terriglobales bacterium]|nr:ABC transporter permease [Terriglobales bacterium]
MRLRARGSIVLALFALLHVLILFAGFIAPYDPAEQHREQPYAPPTRLHLISASGAHLRLSVYGLKATQNDVRENTQHSYAIRLFVRGARYSLLGIGETDLHLFGVQAPGEIHLLGTDAYGRDVFSRLLYGGQISLAAGLVATMVTLLAGMLIGCISGYSGRWVDEALMGTSELFLSLPWLYFLLGLRALLPLHVSPTGTFLLLIGVIGLIGWARPARLVRGVVLSARNRNYVHAARGFGAGNAYLLRRHILPETFGLVLTQAAVLVPQYIAAEVTLSFFGLGVNEPVPSWGNMMSTLQQYSVLTSYGWMLAPAAALVITSVIYWLLADVLQHWLQSRSIV